MGIRDAFLNHPDRAFMCKWAIEFGDPALIRGFAERDPEALQRAAIELNRAPWMVDLVRRHGVGKGAFARHILGCGSVSAMMAALPILDEAQVLEELQRRAADPGQVSEMFEELRERGAPLIERALIATGRKELVFEAAKICRCALARAQADAWMDCEHVMES